MKKGFLCGVIMIILGIFLCSCGNNDTLNNINEQENILQVANEEETEEIIEEENLVSFKLGESIETDILRITLNTAKLTIAVENTNGDSYFLPKEYDLQGDQRNPFVAAKGHTLVAITYTAKNLDRTGVNFDGSFNDNFMSIEYDGEFYFSKTVYGYKSANGWDWEQYNSSNVLLLAGETEIFRCYIDIPIETENLSDTFLLTFNLPNSDGSTESFTYVVTEEDRNAIAMQEISLEEAIYTFPKQKATEYFQNHIKDFSNLSGDQINEVVISGSKHIIIKESYGHWYGLFVFEDDGRIKETLLSLKTKDTGYFNERTWSVDGDMLILATPKETIECEVKEISESTFLLVSDGAPYALIY